MRSRGSRTVVGRVLGGSGRVGWRGRGVAEIVGVRSVKNDVTPRH